MTRLTLLRHAKSSWDHPDLRDLDRPLNSRGNRDAPLMGAVCRDSLPPPDLILLSPSRRTRETVEALVEGWGLENLKILVEDRLYLASASDWAEVLSGYADSAGHILGCGHQPGLGNFAGRLDSGFDREVPTATVISMKISGSDLRRLSGRTVFYAVPRDFR